MTLPAMSVLIAAMSLSFSDKNMRMIRYPESGTTNGQEEVRLLPGQIPGATTNRTSALDGKAAVSMAGTAAAYCDRIFFGESASWDTPQTNVLWETKILKDGAPRPGPLVVNIFGTKGRDFSKRRRISRAYDEACSDLLSDLGDTPSTDGFFQESGRTSSMTRDTGGDCFLYWSSSAFEDEDQLLDGSPRDSLIQAVGGVDNFKKMFRGFHDIMRKSTFDKKPFEPPPPHKMHFFDGPEYDGYEDVPYHQDFRGMLAKYYLTDRGGDEWNELYNAITPAEIDDFVFPSIEGVRVRTFSEVVSNVYGDAAAKVPFEALWFKKFDRISHARFALANQTLGLMDTTFTPWTVGERPLFVHGSVTDEPNVTRMYDNPIKRVRIYLDPYGHGIYIYQDRYDYSHPVEIVDTNTPPETVSRERHCEALLSFSPRVDCEGALKTKPGTVMIDVHGQLPFTVVDNEYEFDEMIFENDGNVYVQSRTAGDPDRIGAWFFDDAPTADNVESSRILYSAIAKVSLKRPRRVEVYNAIDRDYPGGDNPLTSNRAKYPSRSAYDLDLVKSVKQYKVFMMRSTADTYGGEGRFDEIYVDKIYDRHPEYMEFKFAVGSESFNGNFVTALSQAANVFAVSARDWVLNRIYNDTGIKIDSVTLPDLFNLDIAHEILDRYDVSDMSFDADVKDVFFPDGWDMIKFTINDEVMLRDARTQRWTKAAEDGYGRAGIAHIEIAVPMLREDVTDLDKRAGSTASVAFPRKTIFKFTTMKMDQK